MRRSTFAGNQRLPAMDASNHAVESDVTPSYNCIAWALGYADAVWWPFEIESADAYWPAEVPRGQTVDAFEAAFAKMGYCRCATHDLAPTLEKVAIFATEDGDVTHAARQRADGWWTSKLGRAEDVRHTLEALEGPTYGRVVCVLARPR